jgi:hypothetical protein
MALTLNQIIDRIETLALSHKQVESFVILKETVDAYLSNGDKTYPVILCELSDGGGIDRQTRQVSIPMRLFFLDAEKLVDDAQGNTVEIWSDRILVAQDFIAMLLKETNTEEYRDWRIDGGNQLAFYSEKFSDYVAGVSVDITIRLPYDVNRCQAPIE